MDILERIISHKKSSLAYRKQVLPASAFEAMPLFHRQTYSLYHRLNAPSALGVIAEFKRRSPSKGVINDRADVATVAADYALHGAAAISVLTDEVFFGGTVEDLMRARACVEVPILRKDFVIEEYQILEAKAVGADLILLIAACLTPSQVKELAQFARSLDLDVLLELHGEDELEHVCDEANLIGINNRNLKNFQVDVDQSMRMAGQLPSDRILIAESGIQSPEEIHRFLSGGFRGFLMGERFMKSEHPGTAFKEFMQQI